METLVEYNDKLLGLPAGGIVYLACLCVGYAVKISHKISNDWIPTWVMIFGIILFMAMAPTRNHDVELRIWLTKNASVGLIIGLAAWLTHKLFLKRVEKWLGLFDSDTEFYCKPKDGDSP